MYKDCTLRNHLQLIVVLSLHVRPCKELRPIVTQVEELWFATQSIVHHLHIQFLNCGNNHFFHCVVARNAQVGWQRNLPCIVSHHAQCDAQLEVLLKGQTPFLIGS